MQIYIESTIPSYVVARPARDLLQAARQQLTRDWWESRRSRYELYTSQVVLDEIASGDPEMAKQRLELVSSVPVLLLNDEVRSIARSINSSGLLPASAERDAAHIALATAYEMDVLLTWNCRHIANVAIIPHLRELAASAGYNLPELCTVEEITEDSDD